MAILNTTTLLYGEAPDTAGELIGSYGYTGRIGGSVELALIEPDPILGELGASAFANQNYGVRLLRNDVEIPFKNASVKAPPGAIGKALEVELSNPAESVLDANPVFKLQIGTRTPGTDDYDWKTVIDSATWTGKNFASQVYRDSLSLSMIETVSDKLNLSPRQNKIWYNPAKTTVTDDDTERLRTNRGGYITTTITPKVTLSLYDAFRYAFVQGCGFASYQANLPNFEITRFDLPITSSFQEAVSSLIPAFDVAFFVASNVLWILDKSKPIPSSFTPRSLTASQTPRLTKTIQPQPLIDSFVLEYNQTGNFNAYVQRFEYRTRTAGTYGNVNYTRTEITEEYFDYYNTADASTIIKTELKSRSTETFNYLGIETANETETYTFDSQGKITAETKEIFARVPDLNDSGNLVMQKMRSNTKLYEYANDRFNPRASFMTSRIETISALIAVDAENKYFNEDFEQEYLEAHRAGNLTESMTSRFNAVKTIQENFTQVSRNQTTVQRIVTDHLRNNIPVEDVTDTTTGNNSINQSRPVSKKKVIYRTGVNEATATGNRNVPFSVGELPLFFAEPLAQRKLDNLKILQSGNVDIAGYDETLERGTFFDLLDRAGNSYGIFICEGFEIKIENVGTANARITTVVSCAEVLTESA